MKEILTIEEVKQKLKWNNSYGWIFVEYLYVPIKSIEKNNWNDFAKKIKILSINVQEIILNVAWGYSSVVHTS